MKYILIFAIFSFIASACDTITNFDETIINNSDKVLEVQLLNIDSLGGLHPIDTFEIHTNQSFVIHNYNKIGGPMNAFKDCQNRFVKGLIITTNNFTDTIKKDPNENSNWEWIVLKKSFPNGGHCVCELEIEEDDL